MKSSISFVETPFVRSVPFARDHPKMFPKVFLLFLVEKSKLNSSSWILYGNCSTPHNKLSRILSISKIFLY